MTTNLPGRQDSSRTLSTCTSDASILTEDNEEGFDPPLSSLTDTGSEGFDPPLSSLTDTGSEGGKHQKSIVDQDTKSKRQKFMATVPDHVLPGEMFEVWAGSKRVRLQCPQQLGSRRRVTFYDPVARPTTSLTDKGSQDGKHEKSGVDQDTKNKRQKFMATVPDHVLPGEMFEVWAGSKRTRLQCPQQLGSTRTVTFYVPVTPGETLTPPEASYVITIPDGYKAGNPVSVKLGRCIAPLQVVGSILGGRLGMIHLPYDPLMLAKQNDRWAKNRARLIKGNDKQSSDFRFEVRIPSNIRVGELFPASIGPWIVPVRASAPPGDKVIFSLPFNPNKVKASFADSDNHVVGWRMSGPSRNSDSSGQSTPSGLGPPKIERHVAGGDEETSSPFFLVRSPSDVSPGERFPVIAGPRIVVSLQLKNLARTAQKGQWIQFQLPTDASSTSPVTTNNLQSDLSWSNGLQAHVFTAREKKPGLAPPLGIGYRVLPAPVSATKAVTWGIFRKRHGLRVQIPSTVVHQQQQQHGGFPCALLLDSRFRVKHGKRIIVACPMDFHPGQYITIRPTEECGFTYLEEDHDAPPKKLDVQEPAEESSLRGCWRSLISMVFNTSKAIERFQFSKRKVFLKKKGTKSSHE